MPLPRYAPSGRVACVGRELLCALDFIFLQGTFLQGEVSLPRRGRKPEELLIHDLERAFRLDSNQRGEDFPSARGSKKPLSHRGRKPEGLLVHGWFTVWRERSVWTRTRRNPKGAPQRSRRVEWLLVRARGTYIAGAPELRSGAPAIFAPPTGLEPVTLRLTVECSAN